MDQRVIARIAGRLSGDEWQQLGIKLGVEWDKIKNLISTPQGGPAQYGLRMLSNWRNENAKWSPEQVRNEVAAQLGEIGRNDLADQLTREIRTEKDIIPAFQNISPALAREWRTLGIYMNIDPNKLDVICTPQLLTSNPQLEMLVNWQRNTPADQQEQMMRTGLEALGRRDILRDLDESETKSVTAKVRSEANFEASQPTSSTGQSSSCQPHPSHSDNDRVQTAVKTVVSPGASLLHDPFEPQQQSMDTTEPPRGQNIQGEQTDTLPTNHPFSLHSMENQTSGGARPLPSQHFQGATESLHSNQSVSSVHSRQAMPTSTGQMSTASVSSLHQPGSVETSSINNRSFLGAAPPTELGEPASMDSHHQPLLPEASLQSLYNPPNQLNSVTYASLHPPGSPLSNVHRTSGVPATNMEGDESQSLHLSHIAPSGAAFN